MTFDLADVQLQTLLLRILHSVFILVACIELCRSVAFIDNHRLERIVWRLAFFFLAFFSFRVLAGILDSFLAFTVGWFSNIVNVIFWGIVLWKCRRARLIIQSPKNDHTRTSLRGAFDELLDQMDVAKQNLQRLKEQATK